MFKLTPITKEEKPSVVTATDSFITETYEIENESDYQKEIKNECKRKESND